MIDQVIPTESSNPTPVTSPLIVDASDTETLVVQPSHNQTPKILLVVVVVILILIGVVLAYFWSQSPTHDVVLTAASPLPELNASPVVSPMPAGIETFSDPRVQGMNFAYDPEVWTVTTSPLNSGTTLVLTAEDGSQLTMDYGIPLGRGGSIHLLKNNELVTLANGLSRIRPSTGGTASSDMYQYGESRTGGTTPETSYSTVVLFGVQPQARENLLKQCVPEYEGMRVLTEAECFALDNTDLYVGYVQEPVYQELVTKATGDRTKIEPAWSVFTDPTMDPSVLLVTAQYQGPNPAAADEIMSQLKF